MQIWCSFIGFELTQILKTLEFYRHQASVLLQPESLRLWWDCSSHSVALLLLHRWTERHWGWAEHRTGARGLVHQIPAGVWNSRPSGIQHEWTWVTLSLWSAQHWISHSKGSCVLLLGESSKVQTENIPRKLKIRNYSTKAWRLCSPWTIPLPSVKPLLQSS